MAIQLRNITKSFKKAVVLHDVSLDIAKGEFVALLGPSGSGKTTLLRIIAGLDFADEGAIYLNGQDTSLMNVRERRVGFVFQHYALFKHMTVFENVAFGLRVKDKGDRPSRSTIKDTVMRLLSLVHLTNLHEHYPNQLSGGQRQRVALARVLAIEPQVLLMDEPFGALDAKVRKELRRWLRKLHEEMNITTIFVTHDQEEAMEVSDKIAVMSYGRIEQFGPPEEIWKKPANAFVYDFLGTYNEFDGWKDDDDAIHLIDKRKGVVKKSAEPVLPRKNFVARLWEAFKCRWTTTALPGKKNGDGKSGDSKSGDSNALVASESEDDKKVFQLYARPHELLLSCEKPAVMNVWAKIVHVNLAGPTVKIDLERRDGALIMAELSLETYDQLNLQKDDTVYVTPKTFRIFE